MSPFKKEKKFLELPRYSGGKEALSKFLKENLRYPQAALQKGIEGKVVVHFEIDDDGIVHNPVVAHGIGGGCDEEALRLVGLLRYQKVNNHGKRVRTRSKINISFRIPGQQVMYTVKSTPKTTEPVPKKPQENIYTYTITLPS